MATSARLEELQQKFNENPRRYFAPLANELRKLGDFDQAIALCQTHLPQQPQHVSGHIVLAQALFEAGNTPEARSTFEAALDLDPENLIALRYLGDIARVQGEHLTARQLYERVLDADPRNDEIAQLIRSIEQSAATPQAAEAAEAEPAAGAPSAEPEAEEIAASAEPNEVVAEASQPETPEPEPIEDLATAWQHEVAALEKQDEPQVQESAYADLPVDDPVLALPEANEPSYHEPEPSYQAEMSREQEPSHEEPEPVADLAPVEESHEPEPEIVAEADFAPVDTMESNLASATIEPNEPWAEPDADFVDSVPTVEPMATAPAPQPFAEIDYSVFEAVADEEVSAPAPTPEPVIEEALAEPLAQYEAPAEQYEASMDLYETPAEQYEAPAAAVAPADDWFATASAPEIETLPADVSSEAAFDLDAAFQQVLPNNGELAEPEIEQMEVPQSSLAGFDDLRAVHSEEISSEHTAPAEAEPALPSIESGDGVDDAFAELDRMTASLESDNEGRGMLLQDEQYAASAPTEEIEVPQHVDALIGRTPDSGVPAVEEAPAAFVTETMAELYLQQGFREEALAVYRQLLAMSPDDAVLASRVAALEAQVAPAAAVDDAADLPTFRFETSPARPDALGQSVRAFLGVFARRRAPMRRREPAIPQPDIEAQPESPLSALFGTPRDSDDASAAVLAGAFAAPNGESGPLPGRPTRAAVEELRLGDVFGNSTPASAPRAASFDEFFSSGSAEQSAQSALDEEGSDMVQFTAWLEGLKKK